MGTMTPEARVGKTANVVIFLGLLYTVMSLVSVFSTVEAAQQWSHAVTLLVAGGVIALGYGIRYGRVSCLYAATVVFVGLAGYFFILSVCSGAFRPMVRFLLSGWAVVLLCRAIPAMSILKQTHSRPLQTSRFGAFFLRRNIR